MKWFRNFILATAALLITALPAAAASNPKSITYKGISLAPAIQNVTLESGQAASEFTITLDNNLKTPITLSASSLDFKSLNESGGLAFIGSNGNHKYGLANWLVVPKGPITLKPNESKQVLLKVENRADLSPGGHYAAVLFKNSGQGSGANKVDLNQVIATLVFVKKKGGEIYSLKMAKPNFGSSWLKIPSNLHLFISNDGNVQTSPRGTVSITSPTGNQVARGIINPDSALVLPESIRFFSTDLFSTAKAWLPGSYKVSIFYRPDDVNSGTTAEYSFFYAAPVALLAILALIVLIVMLIRSFRRRKNK